MVIAPNAWWFKDSTSKQIANMNNVRTVTEEMNALRKGLEDWKIKWRDITAHINNVYNSNIQLLGQRDGALETIESLQRQLKVRTKMIDELRSFAEQEKLYISKLEKRHKETLEEIEKRKKKRV